jgi:shikimate dehydrogenase
MSPAILPPQKQMTAMLGHPVAENPIDRMFDSVYAYYGLLAAVEVRCRR